MLLLPLLRLLTSNPITALCSTTRVQMNDSFVINSSGYFSVKTDFSEKKKELETCKKTAGGEAQINFPFPVVYKNLALW